MRAAVKEARKNQMLAACPDMGEAGLLAIIEERNLMDSDDEWSEWVRKLGEEYQQRVAARALQELIDTRVARLKEAGWEVTCEPFDTDDGQVHFDGNMTLYVNGSESHVDIGTLPDMPEGEMSLLEQAGLEELARRKAAHEEAIKQQERDRLAREKAEQEERDRLEMEQRIARDGDKEWVRQCMDLLKGVGSKMTEVLPNVKTQAVREKISAQRDMLRGMYTELNKLEQ